MLRLCSARDDRDGARRATGSADGPLWISYKGTAAGDHATGTVAIRCVETTEEFVIPIKADTIDRPTAAMMLVRGSLEQHELRLRRGARHHAG